MKPAGLKRVEISVNQNHNLQQFVFNQNHNLNQYLLKLCISYLIKVQIVTTVQWTQLNGITLGWTITDPINQMIPNMRMSFDLRQV
jgi:hypothetical protein